MKFTSRITSCLTFAGALLATSPAHALNYFDLEVYGYDTLKKGERLIENKNNYTYDGTDAPAPENNDDLLRSTFEFAYGITDKTEVAAYLDFSNPRDGGWRHAHVSGECALGHRVGGRHPTRATGAEVEHGGTWVAPASV